MRAQVVLLMGACALLGACAGSTTPPVGPGPSVRGPLRDGDQAAYRIEEGGRVVGRLHTRYTQTEDRRQLVTRVVWGAARADGSIIPVRTVEYATQLRLDFTPVSFKRLSSAQGTLTLAFRGGRMAQTTELDAKEIVLDTAPAALPWSVDDLGALALLVKKRGLEPGNSGQLELRDPESGRLETPLVQVFADAQRRTVVQLPQGKATFNSDGWVQSFEATGGRRYVRLETPGDAPQLLPTPAPLRYDRPAQAGWRDREVLIDVQGAQLAGTLSMPRAISGWASGMAPAVVFISDLEAQNRHGHTNAIDYGTWQLLDALTEAGFAVLRVDDRGVAGSKVSSVTVKDDLQTAVEDAEACLTFMRRQPSVDPDRAFVIGHGFGARVAAEVATRQTLAGLVLLAPAYRSPSEVLAEPYVQIAEVDPAQAERRMRLVIQAVAGSEAAQARSAAEDMDKYRAVSDRLSSYVEQDLNPVLAKVPAPIAVFQGMRDFENSWMLDAKKLVDEVNARRRRQAKLFIYELVDHHLKTESGRSTPERYLDRGRRLDLDLLRDLAAWMREAAGASR